MDDSSAWKELKPQDITHCEVCGKKIWKYWYAEDINVYAPGANGEIIETKHREMTKCAPCFYGRK